MVYMYSNTTIYRREMSMEKSIHLYIFTSIWSAFFCRASLLPHITDTDNM